MPDSRQPVLFGRGKKQSYNNLAVKDENTFYFLYDTRELYQGSKLYTESIRFYTGELPNTYAAGVLYFNEETGVGSVFNGVSWRDIIQPAAKVIIDYNELSNIPIKKLEGNPVILNSLESGIYSINGTWAVIDGADTFTSSYDSLFYITNTGGDIKVTHITSGGVSVISSGSGSVPDDVIYGSALTAADAIQEIKRDLWEELA